MSKRFSLGVLTLTGTNAAAGWEIRAASAKGALLVELGFSLVAATATTIGLGRPAAIGITPTTPVAFKSDRLFTSGAPTDATVLSALAWGTAPTVPTSFIRQIGLPAVIGSSIIWKFEDGIVIPAAKSLVLWNLASNSVLNAYAVVEE